MRYLHPLAGCPSIAARRQPLEDASAAVFPSPLFLVASTTQPYGTPAPQDRGPPLPVCSSPSLLVPFYLRACLLASLPPLSALLGGFWMGPAGWFGVSCHGGGGSQVDQETRIVAWVAPHGSSTLWPWPPRASSQPLSAPTIRGWCFAAHSQIFSASRRHSRPAMTRNPDQPYSPSTPLLGCLGGCSTFTRTWPGHVLVCALFVIKYLCHGAKWTDGALNRVEQSSSSLFRDIGP